MDGNGRWARRRNLPRTAGHTEGEENLAAVVRLAVKREIGWLTVFGFSTENWVRPRLEVRHILGLHKKLFGRVAELNELNVRVQWIGRPFDSPEARTPGYVQKAIVRAIADTAANTGMVLTVAFDYGSRAELVHAAECAAARTRDRITADDFDAGMYLPELPQSTWSCAPLASAGSPTSCSGNRPGHGSTSPSRPGPTSEPASSTRHRHRSRMTTSMPP